MPYLLAQNITKHYLSSSSPFGPAKRVDALKGIGLSVNKGELFGVIGPDGSGKTTLFRILNTLLLADQGMVTIDGYDVVRDYRHIREIAGYVPGRFSLYQDLTVEENLKLFAKVFHTTVEDNYGMIQDIYQQIEPFRKRRAGALSGGMKQKLALCCALIHQPGILFLDEPTTGVDPVSRKEFWAVLKRLSNEGITILVSTPYMDEARLCDRILLIKEGEELLTETPQNIVNTFDQTLYSARSNQMYKLLKDLRTYEQTTSCYSFGDSHHFTLQDGSVKQLHEFLDKNGHTDLRLQTIAPDIEDCFIHLSDNRPAHENS